MIAQFIARKAIARERTNYPEVANAVGWGNPKGQGLGRQLKPIVEYCHNSGLPKLTAIVAKTGKLHPSKDAIALIEEITGKFDITEAQESVLDFDWTIIPEFGLDLKQLLKERDVWLTSGWDFIPEEWGCIGFATPSRCEKYETGSLVIIYITRDSDLKEERGKVVGIVETSGEVGPTKDYVSSRLWKKKENNPKTKGKWPWAVGISRAWYIKPKERKDVREIFSSTCENNHDLNIGTNGVRVDSKEIEEFLQFNASITQIYHGTISAEQTAQTEDNKSQPSRAGPTASKPYEVGESDGPKYLYILELQGDIAAYLGCKPEEVNDKKIIKVGFSKSPVKRKNQIQSSYPKGVFQWKVFRLSSLPTQAPYSNAHIAIQGENEMKRYLIKHGAESLTREFFLVKNRLIQQAWEAGNIAAKQAQAIFK